MIILVLGMVGDTIGTIGEKTIEMMIILILKTIKKLPNSF